MTAILIVVFDGLQRARAACLSHVVTAAPGDAPDPSRFRSKGSKGYEQRIGEFRSPAQIVVLGLPTQRGLKRLNLGTAAADYLFNPMKTVQAVPIRMERSAICHAKS